MKKLLLITLSAFIITGCFSTRNNPDAADHEYSAPQKLYELVTENTKDYLLIDVRTAEEYEAGHIPGAKHIPYETILDEIPVSNKDALIIVYCRSGRRSGIALDSLTEAGYTNVINFGSYKSWPGELIEGPSPH